MTTNELQTAASAQNPAATTSAKPGADAAAPRALVPRVDVFEDDTGITLLADLPGVPKDALDLQVDGDVLTIDAPVRTQLPERLEPVYAELRVPRWRRAFTLSRELDASRISANLKDGVLQLRIPKQAHAQPRRIAVQAA